MEAQRPPRLKKYNIPKEFEEDAQRRYEETMKLPSSRYIDLNFNADMLVFNAKPGEVSPERIREMPDAPIARLMDDTLVNQDNTNYEALEEDLYTRLAVLRGEPAPAISDAEFEQRYAALTDTNVETNRIVATVEGAILHQRNSVVQEIQTTTASIIQEFVARDTVNNAKHNEMNQHLLNIVTTLAQDRAALSQSQSHLEQRVVQQDLRVEALLAQNQRMELLMTQMIENQQRSMIAAPTKEDYRIQSEIGKVLKSGVKAVAWQAVKAPVTLLRTIFFDPAFRGFQILMGPFYTVYCILCALFLMLLIVSMGINFYHYSPRTFNYIVGLLDTLFSGTKDRYLKPLLGVATDSISASVSAGGSIWNQVQPHKKLLGAITSAISYAGNIIYCSVAGRFGGFFGGSSQCNGIWPIDGKGKSRRRKSPMKKRKSVRKSGVRGRSSRKSLKRKLSKSNRRKSSRHRKK